MNGRVCPACGDLTTAASHCGVPFDRPFVMNKPRVIALRRFAHGRKGLDEDTYRLHLQAVGARSTVDLDRPKYDALLKRLQALPDRPQQQGRASSC